MLTLTENLVEAVRSLTDSREDLREKAGLRLDETLSTLAEDEVLDPAAVEGAARVTLAEQ